MNKILIISHDATLTGAPKLLLNLMSVLKKQGIAFNTLLKDPSGQLCNQFKNYSTLFDHYYTTSHSVFRRLSNKLFNSSACKPVSNQMIDVDFVLNNTITNGDVLIGLRKKYSGPILTYVHELEIAAHTYATKEGIQSTIKCTDLFMVPCYSVKSFLVDKLNVPANKISILNYFIGSVETDKISNASTALNKSETFIVGGCGTQDWRKGADIFLQVAKNVVTNHPEANISFKWKGANIQSTDHLRIMYDLEKMNISDKVEFIPSSTDTAGFYSILDLFILPSREDPYPLVVLEAASFATPSISFLTAGGACEFIADDAGTAVEYLSVDQMASSIIQYYNDPEMLKKKGQCALKKLQALHQDPALILKQLNEAFLKAKDINGH